VIRLLLVDDHAMLLEGLARQFTDREDMQVVGRAGTGREALEQAGRLQPDVVTLDVSLPDMSGISLIPHLKALCPTPRILILTMYDHERYAASALEAGADGFLAKGAPFEELERAVREVALGRRYVPLQVAEKLKDRWSAAGSAALEALSQREFAVLIELSRGKPLKQVADELGISDKTVSTYRARLMKKLDLASSSDLVRFALERGLLK
jgi:two-component system invasion response regulator UvrY